MMTCMRPEHSRGFARNFVSQNSWAGILTPVQSMNWAGNSLESIAARRATLGNMRRHISSAILAVLTLTSLSAQRVHPEELKMKPRIDTAIRDGIESLLDAQLADGSWGVKNGHVGGHTGLCAYALLKSGVRMNHPSLRRAFIYLDSVIPKDTYAIACMMLAYGATRNLKQKGRLRELLTILLACQHKQGAWAYPHGGPDLSNTQYAALGLWTASKAGLKVPPEAWNKSKKFVPIEMNANPLAPTVYEIPKARKVRKMVLKIVKRGGKEGLPVGFAEIVFGGARKSKAR